MAHSVPMPVLLAIVFGIVLGWFVGRQRSQ